MRAYMFSVPGGEKMRKPFYVCINDVKQKHAVWCSHRKPIELQQNFKSACICFKLCRHRCAMHFRRAI